MPLDHDARTVTVVDTPTARVHHQSDLLSAVLSGTGILLVLALATYAQNTTTGVTEDVMDVAAVLRRLLQLPVAVLETIVAVVVPIGLVITLLIRRQTRQALEALAALLLALLAAVLTARALEAWALQALIDGMSVRISGQWVLTVPSSIAGLAAMLTVPGTRSRRPELRWSWNLLWVAVGVSMITAQVSLTGMGVALLLGRGIGMLIRYTSGVMSERAYGDTLIAGVRRSGFDPVTLVRVADDEHHPSIGVPADGSTAALARATGLRVYAMTCSDESTRDVVVLDGDRQVIGLLQRAWRSLRLRGIDGRSVVSLRQVAERSALLSYAAGAAGVRTPRVLAIGEAGDSMLLVQQTVTRAVAFSELDDAEITDEVLQAIWAQLRRAHDAGIAHRALTSETIMVDGSRDEPSVWLIGWESGDVASSELARLMDITQLVALLAVRVGATRALASATAVLPETSIEAIGPLLQTIALPRRTRDQLRAHKQVLADLRAALVQRLPDANVEPQRLTRFGLRTVLTILVTVIAAIAVLTTVNVREVTAALGESDWRWSLVSLALGMLTFVGAGLALVAFSPVRIPIIRATLVQAAASFVSLAAPAGFGPAAMNLRTLTRRGVPAALAAATVALVQVSQLVVTLALLLVLSIASGTNQSTKFSISLPVLIAIGVLVLLVGIALLVPQVRQWIVRTTVPTLRQTWPRLLALLSQPWRLALGIAGNAVMSLGYVLAFDACLAAFDIRLSLVQVAIIYLAGNAAGSAVPTPGGVGTVEAALTAGLISAGVNPGIAASTAVLFRLLTFWLRVPAGWAAMRLLQRKGEL